MTILHRIPVGNPAAGFNPQQLKTLKRLPLLRGQEEYLERKLARAAEPEANRIVIAAMHAAERQG